MRSGHFERNAPGYAAGTGAEVKHPGSLHLHCTQAGLPHKDFRLRTGDEDSGANVEAPAVKVLETSNILQRLATDQPFQRLLQFCRGLKVGPYDMIIGQESADVFCKTRNEAPRLTGRIQSLEPAGALAYELREQHYEFSMIVERNCVTVKPASRTILGTREALVIPGMVLTSRK